MLYLIRAIAPSLISSQTWCDNLECVLDKFIAKGSMAALLRREELRQLEQILAPLTPKPHRSFLPPMDLNENEEPNEDAYGLNQVDINEGPEWDLLGLNSSVSLPPQDLLDLANQLDVESIIRSVGTGS